MASDKNLLLYQVTEVLDGYDFGNTASNEPGEYVVEAREIIAMTSTDDRLVTAADIIGIMTRQFSWQHKPFLIYRYMYAAKKINKILRENRNMK